MMKEELIIGKAVMHFKYGLGTVIELEDFYMSIQFGKDSIKKFRYPDAFESFLSTKDKELFKNIQKDLDERHNEPDYIEHKKANDLYIQMREFEKKKAAEQEEKRLQQIEKQRRSQMLSRQRMLQYDRNRSKDTTEESK